MTKQYAIYKEGDVVVSGDREGTIVRVIDGREDIQPSYELRMVRGGVEISQEDIDGLA